MPCSSHVRVIKEYLVYNTSQAQLVYGSSSGFFINSGNLIIPRNVLFSSASHFQRNFPGVGDVVDYIHIPNDTVNIVVVCQHD